MTVTWVFNEKGNVQATLEYQGQDTLFEMRPPTGGEVEDIGVFAYNNPGNQLGAMMLCATKCLQSPVITLEQLRQADALVAMEVVKGLSSFPVFAKG